MGYFKAIYVAADRDGDTAGSGEPSGEDSTICLPGACLQTANMTTLNEVRKFSRRRSS
jgi:hypothetical protein